MTFRWPIFARHRALGARLQAIYIATAAGQPMVAVDAIEAVAGAGLKGDRYCKNTGFWKALEACQVTLISRHDLECASRRGGPDLTHGSHRRNLVVEGIRTKALEERTFRIGGAIFRYHKPRPPCGYLDKIQGKGVAHALGKHSGVCLQILGSGLMQTGEPLQIIDGDGG